MSLELLVYPIGADDAPAPEAALREALPAGATSWTPPAERCLVAGRYAWTVRPGAAPVPSRPAEPLLFSVAADERDETIRRLERAIATLTAATPSHSEAPQTKAAAAPTPVGKLARPAGVASGTFAMRATQLDVSGQTFGVVGINSSAQGAGIGARNSANGPDLVLDGAAAGATDAALSEGGLDRASAGGETFNIQNSGAGTMTLQVDGNPVQRRVGGTCPSCQMMQGVNADGSVVCTSIPGCTCTLGPNETCQNLLICPFPAFAGDTRTCDAASGTVSCTAGGPNTANCARCGDGIRQTIEACDRTQFQPSNDTCQDAGFDTGSVSCRTPDDDSPPGNDAGNCTVNTLSCSNVCGSGTCRASTGECATGCVADCHVSVTTACCGDGICSAVLGENASNCNADC